MPIDAETCTTCGAPLEAGSHTCPYATATENMPWGALFQAVAKGSMTVQQHELVMNRWQLHHCQSYPQAVVDGIKAVAFASSGKDSGFELLA